MWKKLVSILKYLGIQDTSRKRTAPSLESGTWADCVAYSNKEIVYRLVTQAKWDKEKWYLELIQNKIGTRDD